MQRINEASLAPLNALVFAGENDHIISSQLSQQLSTQFESPVFILSTEAGHHLPDPSDPTFSQVTDFLAATQIPHDDDPNHVDDPDIPEGMNDARFTLEDLPQVARLISLSAHSSAKILSVTLHANTSVSPMTSMTKVTLKTVRMIQRITTMGILQSKTDRMIHWIMTKKRVFLEQKSPLMV